MANIKSQIKRNKQNDKRRLRNRVYRGTARIAVKNARTSFEEGVPESKAALVSAISALDKAVEQGVLHKNNAARRKSRLMKAFAKMGTVKVEAGPAVVAPAAEPEPAASPKVKKAAPRRRAAKPEPAAEVPAEAEVEVKKTPVKRTSAKKAPAKKAGTTTKKPAAKKKA